MRYFQVGGSNEKISSFVLGGHEYLPSGKSRGFNEDFEKATTPNFIFDGFGGENRKNVIRKAFDYGVNFFDVTQDSEKEALGRNLREMGTPYDVYVLTRPEGMVYSYDENNRKMADYGMLKAEVQRILRLMRRERIEFFNFAFMKDAWLFDPDYFDKMKENIRRLKQEGLILFSCADTFSGEETYLKQVQSGIFDMIYLNFNFGDWRAKKKVLPLCQEKGIGVIAREVYMKGQLFGMAKEADIDNKALVANAALKWVMRQSEVSCLVYGSGKVNHVEEALRLFDHSMDLTPEEEDIIEKIKTTDGYRTYERKRAEEFMGKIEVKGSDYK